MMPRWRSVLSVVLSCMAMGALPAVVEALFAGMTPRGFALSAFSGFIYASCIAVPCLAVLPAINYRLRRWAGAARLAANIAVLAVFAVAGCFVANLILIS